MNNVEDFDEVPPLEDIPNLEAIKAKVDDKKEPKTPEVTVIKQEEFKGNKKSQQKESFAGFKKGFLFGNPKSSTAGSEDSLINLKINQNTSNRSAIFKEVESIKETNSNPAWITDDFLDKIETNDALKKGFSNPYLMNKVTKFQKDPQGALKECENDPEAMNFMREFCKLMGTHLTQNMPQTTNNTQLITKFDPEQEKANKLLESSEVKELLMDKEIQNLLMELQKNPEKGN